MNEVICCLKSRPSLIFPRSKAAKNVPASRFTSPSWICISRREASRTVKAFCCPKAGAPVALRITPNAKASLAPQRTNLIRALSPTLTAFRTVKDDPHDKGAGKIREFMDFTCGGKHNVALCEPHALLFIDEPSADRGDHLDLVTSVRLLQVL